MRIALVGTAPASINLAPYSDPTWKIWACSPGAYYRVPRSECWFETHRWEPGIVGKPETQVPWYSPEYVAWLKKHPCVWMFDAPEEMPNAHMIPHEGLRAKYGDYFFTSSLAWMAAMAIEAILMAAHKGDVGPHALAFYGVDMAANEEYGYQRAGCQYFAQIAEGLGIEVVIPKESDLMTPPPLYGLSERSHRGVKLTSRKAEIDNRLKMAETKKSMAEQEVSFLTGAKDDLDYHMKMWNFDGEPNKAKFAAIFALPQAPEEPESDE